MKLLSIIVPSYNMEKYLPKCLGSLIVDDPALLQQLDVVVVNDGSKDLTSEIAHEFEAKFPGVFRVIDKTNGNYGSCINAALPLAQGKYVKVLDADDWFDTDGLKKFLGFLKDHDADLVISDYTVVTIRDGGSDKELKRYSFPVDSAFTLKEFVASKDYLPMHAFTYAVQRLREINYTQCEGVSYSDMEWSTIPLCNVHALRYCPAIVYCYLRGREGQTMDPIVYAKNRWKYGVVALHMLGTFKKVCSLQLEVEALEIVRKAMVRLIDGVYRYGIIADLNGDDSSRLHQFEDNLKSQFPDFYHMTDVCVYSRRFRYHYIRRWRSHWKGHRLMMRLCRIYSKITGGAVQA